MCPFMVATGQEKVREKVIFQGQGKSNFSRSGKSQGIFILVRENGNFEKKSGKLVHGQGKFRVVSTLCVEYQYSVSYFSTVILLRILAFIIVSCITIFHGTYDEVRPALYQTCNFSYFFRNSYFLG